MTLAKPWRGVTVAIGVAETRIQLCGPLVARIDGLRVEGQLPGRQGRLMFAYLVHERRRVGREELVSLLWDDTPPEAVDSALSALLSKLRRIVEVEGRHVVRLMLPTDAWVDVHSAREALHRAESAAALLPRFGPSARPCTSPILS